MVVYIDALILENFIVNLFLLIMTMKVSRYDYKKTIYVAALIGALYTLFLFLNMPMIVVMPINILVVVVMLLASMKNINIMRIIKSAIIFLVISFTLCGVCFSFSMIDNKYSVYNSITISNYSIKYIIISLMIIYIVIVRGVDYLKERALINGCIYDIELYNKDKIYSFKGFLDTGNGLREPVTNLPCIIVENEYLVNFNLADDEMFYVSYSTIGEEGRLKGFKVEKVRIKAENKEWRTVDAIICSCGKKLSKENEFNALLSRGIV